MDKPVQLSNFITVFLQTFMALAFFVLKILNLIAREKTKEQWNYDLEALMLPLYWLSNFSVFK